MASTGAMIWICRPSVSWSAGSARPSRSAGVVRTVASSQKIGRHALARARLDGKPDPVADRLRPWSGSCARYLRLPTVVVKQDVRGVDDADRPRAAISKVLSCEPYSSAFCAISPTFGTLPIVDGSSAPWAWQSRSSAS